MKKTIADWRTVSPEYYGDYYPLMPYTLSDTEWIAWQYNRPEAGSGMIQAFRHENSPYESIRLKLQGLDKRAIYEVTDLDKPGPQEIAGSELYDRGLLVVIESRRGWRSSLTRRNSSALSTQEFGIGCHGHARVAMSGTGNMLTQA